MKDSVITLAISILLFDEIDALEKVMIDNVSQLSVDILKKFHNVIVEYKEKVKKCADPEYSREIVGKLIKEIKENA